jgi:hypothetical protein
MEPKNPSPYPQVPATCPYLEPNPSSLHDPPPNFLKLTFQVPSNMSLFHLQLCETSTRNTPPRGSEWGSSLPPDCFVSRGSISTVHNLLLDSNNGGAVAVCSNGHDTPSNLMLSRYNRLRFHITFPIMTLRLLPAHFHCTKIS